MRSGKEPLERINCLAGHGMNALPAPAQESERRLRDLLAGKKPEGAADAAAVASVGKKKSVAARSSQMQMFQVGNLTCLLMSSAQIRK